MKLANIIFLIMFSNLTHCQVNKSHNLKEIKCRKELNKHEEKLRNTQISKMELYQGHLNLLDCPIYLSNNGDNKAREILLQVCKRGWENLNEERSLGGYRNTFEIAAIILIKIGNKESFEMGMKYFSVNKDYFDILEGVLDDYPNNHFGLKAFQQILLPLMEETSQTYYKKLYDEVSLDVFLNSEDDDEIYFKKIYTQFYPLIKADWEAGKIKLKDLNNE